MKVVFEENLASNPTFRLNYKKWFKSNSKKSCQKSTYKIIQKELDDGFWSDN